MPELPTDFTDDELVVLYDGLWTYEDNRLDPFEPHDMGKMLGVQSEARKVLQRVMDARGVVSEMSEHVSFNGFPSMSD